MISDVTISLSTVWVWEVSRPPGFRLCLVWLPPPALMGGDVNKTIFIADDNPMVLALMRQALEAQPGFEVCGEAADGEDAIIQASKLHPDLIVLDISMPVMGGLEAAHKLRQIMPTLPILMFTIHRTRLSSAEVFAAGANGVAFKGDGMGGLVSQARSLLHCEDKCA
jgi:DNA-binding NarL/FixJ family response regulator